jgi:hypothetical protein
VCRAGPGVCLDASAQARVQAGSDEDKALRKINALTSPDAQIPMLLDFEKQYPKSQALSEVYAMLVDIYMTKQDNAKIIEYGEKAIKRMKRMSRLSSP